MLHDLLYGIYFAQIVGFVALAVSLAVFQVNKRSTMLKLQMLAALLYGTHFFLLGAFTGAAMNGVGAVRNYSYHVLGERRHAWWIPGMFIAFFAVAGILTWHGPLSLLPMGASITGTIAYWQSSPRVIRLLELISPPLWIVYNVVVGSYPGILAEVFVLSSTLIGVYRFDIRKTQVAQTEVQAQKAIL